VDTARVARNDAIFQDTNEQIEDTAAELGVNDVPLFVCERAAPDCTAILRLSGARDPRD